MKTLCRKCNIKKPLNQFYVSNAHCCISCKKIIKKEWRKNNPEKDRMQRRRYAKTPKHIAYQQKYQSRIEEKFRRWKMHAEDRGLEFSITLEDIKKMPMKCFYTGVDLTYQPKLPNTMSLDRIDNTKGYINGNVALCCWEINKLKSTFDFSKFICMCKQVANHNPIFLNKEK